MPLTNDPASGWPDSRSGKPPKIKPPKKPKKPRGHRGKSSKGTSKTKKTVKHPAGKWHEAASHPAGADTRATTGSLGTPHLAGSALPAYLLSPGSALDRVPGITGVLLDLVGEGAIGLHAALASWQAEQTRLTNRAWRRPGGLARMGSL